MRLNGRQRAVTMAIMRLSLCRLINELHGWWEEQAYGSELLHTPHCFTAMLTLGRKAHTGTLITFPPWLIGTDRLGIHICVFIHRPNGRDVGWMGGLFKSVWNCSLLRCESLSSLKRGKVTRMVRWSVFKRTLKKVCRRALSCLSLKQLLRWALNLMDRGLLGKASVWPCRCAWKETHVFFFLMTQDQINPMAVVCSGFLTLGGKSVARTFAPYPSLAEIWFALALASVWLFLFYMKVHGWHSSALVYTVTSQSRTSCSSVKVMGKPTHAQGEHANVTQVWT